MIASQESRIGIMSPCRQHYSALSGSKISWELFVVELHVGRLKADKNQPEDTRRAAARRQLCTRRERCHENRIIVNLGYDRPRSGPWESRGEDGRIGAVDHNYEYGKKCFWSVKRYFLLGFEIDWGSHHKTQTLAYYVISPRSDSAITYTFHPKPYTAN
jgi:hypothetical protein